ncbi:MAG: hypothetical protein KDD70_07600 [Bdellovibrionales bacterium]|nr:hypothetical protein [Bdellovibrionales bacterium]
MNLVLGGDCTLLNLEEKKVRMRIPSLQHSVYCPTNGAESGNFIGGHNREERLKRGKVK